MFSPGVALRLTAAADSSVMLICFSCEDIRIITRAGGAEQTAFCDFSPNLAAVTQLVQERFPNDPKSKNSAAKNQKLRLRS